MIAMHETDALVIGSDQVAICRNRVLGKPGNRKMAMSQLGQMKGETLVFYTGLCLINAKNEREQVECVEYEVRFRAYSTTEIDRYLTAEKPYNCAASFKSESFGISLVEAMHGSDPSALVGLPLIRLAAMLRSEGLKIP